MYFNTCKMLAAQFRLAYGYSLRLNELNRNIMDEAVDKKRDGFRRRSHSREMVKCQDPYQ